MEQADLMKVPNAKVGFSKAMSAGWIMVDKSSNPPLVKKKVPHIEDTVQELLKRVLIEVSKVPQKDLQEFKKRKLLQEVTLKSFNLTRGPEFALVLTKMETDLTTDMITSGSWKNLKFKEYNFEALGVPPECGYLHPLLKVIKLLTCNQIYMFLITPYLVLVRQ